MIKNKLKSKQGFSLSEILVALVIMSLTGAAIAVGISVAASAYIDITDSSEASILCSTLTTQIADQIRFADDVSDISIESIDGHITINGIPLLSSAGYMGFSADVEMSGTDIINVKITISKESKTYETAEFSVSPINNNVDQDVEDIPDTNEQLLF